MNGKFDQKITVIEKNEAAYIRKTLFPIQYDCATMDLLRCFSPASQYPQTFNRIPYVYSLNVSDFGTFYEHLKNIIFQPTTELIKLFWTGFSNFLTCNPHLYKYFCTCCFPQYFLYFTGEEIKTIAAQFIRVGISDSIINDTKKLALDCATSFFSHSFSFLRILPSFYFQQFDANIIGESQQRNISSDTTFAELYQPFLNPEYFMIAFKKAKLSLGKAEQDLLNKLLGNSQWVYEFLLSMSYIWDEFPEVSALKMSLNSSAHLDSVPFFHYLLPKTSSEFSITFSNILKASYEVDLFNTDLHLFSLYFYNEISLLVSILSKDIFLYVFMPFTSHYNNERDPHQFEQIDFQKAYSLIHIEDLHQLTVQLIEIEVLSQKIVNILQLNIDDDEEEEVNDEFDLIKQGLQNGNTTVFFPLKNDLKLKPQQNLQKTHEFGEKIEKSTGISRKVIDKLGINRFDVYSTRILKELNKKTSKITLLSIYQAVSQPLIGKDLTKEVPKKLLEIIANSLSILDYFLNKERFESIGIFSDSNLLREQIKEDYEIQAFYQKYCSYKQKLDRKKSAMEAQGETFIPSKIGTPIEDYQFYQIITEIETTNFARAESIIRQRFSELNILQNYGKDACFITQMVYNSYCHRNSSINLKLSKTYQQDLLSSFNPDQRETFQKASNETKDYLDEFLSGKLSLKDYITKVSNRPSFSTCSITKDTVFQPIGRQLIKFYKARIINNDFNIPDFSSSYPDLQKTIERFSNYFKSVKNLEKVIEDDSKDNSIKLNSLFARTDVKNKINILLSGIFGIKQAINDDDQEAIKKLSIFNRPYHDILSNSYKFSFGSLLQNKPGLTLFYLEEFFCYVKNIIKTAMKIEKTAYSDIENKVTETMIYYLYAMFNNKFQYTDKTEKYYYIVAYTLAIADAQMKNYGLNYDYLKILFPNVNEVIEKLYESR